MPRHRPPTLHERMEHIERKLDKIMADLTKLQAAVARNDTAEDSAIALLQELTALIKAIPTTDPTTQAAIDSLTDDLTAKTDAIAAAIVANTPAAPAP